MEKGSEQIRRALGAARVGKVYDLSVELGRPGLRTGHSQRGLISITTSQVQDPTGSGKAFRSELISGPLHHGTHVDMLNHFSIAGASDNPAGGEARDSRPMVCRGVLVDVAAYLGEAVADCFVIGAGLLTAALQAQSIRVRPGDAVLVRTGKADRFADDPEAAWISCPGISRDCVRLLSESGMKVFGIDTASPDPLPIVDWSETAHEELLTEAKIPIVENLYLKDLADEGVKEFLFICAPLRIHNATGAWARPIAIA